MNSALFTEEVVGSLLARYVDRFSLFEESPVTNVVLEKETATLHIKDYRVTAQNVVLCTNGFEKFSITNTVGPDIDTGFHKNVSGTIGYMSAYVDERDRAPIAISYIDTNNIEDPYFYLTRRPYENEHNQKHNLICVGGPELNIEDTNIYSKTEHTYPDEAIAGIDTFLHTTYKHAPRDAIEYKYQWHGLMGYTPNGVRVIGAEPCNPVLMYNLGCNGVGILPSVFGGSKIARILNGEKMKPSIFDPNISNMYCPAMPQE
jgi:glycine/D-amino acid oxidase-like deaminating enzyme